jgi:hypothetical protein
VVQVLWLFERGVSSVTAPDWNAHFRTYSDAHLAALAKANDREFSPEVRRALLEEVARRRKRDGVATPPAGTTPAGLIVTPSPGSLERQTLSDRFYTIPQRTRQRMAISVLIILILAAVIILGQPDNSPSGRARAAQESAYRAYRDSAFNAIAPEYACEQYVRATLKAPRTAEFPSSSEWRWAQKATNRFIVQAYVDAQNSFGAMLRTNFQCDVLHVGATDLDWRVVDFRHW